MAAQRTLGLTSACPSPRGDPRGHDFNGREASVAERDLGESDRERLVKEAQVCNVNRDPDYVDPAKVSPTELFIGRHSLEPYRAEWMASRVFCSDLDEGGLCQVPPMKIVLREGFIPSPVKGMRRYAPRVQAALEPVASVKSYRGV